ncbi:MAG: DUF364 domain-containing protein, partial [Pseudomonadota bacterium]
SKRCGLASTLRGWCIRREMPPVVRAGDLVPSGGLEIARMVFSKSVLEASIGMAAINSLLDVDLEKCVEINASRILAEKGAGKRIAVIGNFPFLSKLKEHADQLWIFERQATAERGEFSEDEMPNLLPKADVVAISATTLINHTLDSILPLLRPDSFKMMLGPSTPLSPVLFEYGFNVLSGAMIVDIPQALKDIGQGATNRQIRGTRRVSISKL